MRDRQHERFAVGKVEFDRFVHDDGPKTVLGTAIPGGLEAADLDRVLEIVAHHPLAHGLAAFATDLGPSQLARTSIIVMSEFGRRVTENSAAGTDHGRGGVMFLLGGGAAGGMVHGTWPGLGPATLVGPGDLPVLHNYRDVVAPLLARQTPGISLEKVFPGHRLQPLDLVS